MVSTQLSTIAPYLPSVLIQAALDDPEQCGRVSSERFQAAVLFADVSRFTFLTQEIVRHGAEGPEELGGLLNRFFESMVSQVKAAGGHIAKFGGDALTAFFAVTDEPLDLAVQRAWQAAKSMQEAMAEFEDVQTRFGAYTWGLKIGIGVGEICAMHVGGISDRWEYVLGGDALVQALEAEICSSPGEVCLSEPAAKLKPDPPVELLSVEPSVPMLFSASPEVEAKLRSYLPFPVRGWLYRDLHDWLAVLHPMTVLFCSVQGIDYENADAVQQLDVVVKAALEVIYRYEGTLARVSVDDKGTSLLVLFGAPPFAHEDDPVRAVRCGLDLVSAIGGLGRRGLTCSAGVSGSPVFAGPVGGADRREYTVMGNAVNLAAKLTVQGSPGTVVCDYATYQASRSVCEFESLAPVRIKGRAGLIRTYRATGRVSDGESEVFALTGRREWVDWDPRTLLGRADEIGRFCQALDDVEAGESRILIVEGEAGIGKSRLVVELTRLARERGLTWLAGVGRSVEQQTPYLAWRDVFSYFFDLDAVLDPDARRARVESIVADLVPDRIDDIAVLDDVLELGFPGRAAGTGRDPALRQHLLTSFLLALLRTWTREQALIVILEDVHWLDSLSWDLALRVTEGMIQAHEPFLLLLSVRPLELSDQQQHVVHLAGMAQTERLSLKMLSPEAVASVAARRLGVSVQALPVPVVSLIQSRAGGNPFFAQELVSSLYDQGLVRILPRDGGQVRCQLSPDFGRAANMLPETVQGLLLARIARLSPESQLTLKVASVIGRVFAYQTLRQTLGRYAVITDDILERQLDELAALDLTTLNSSTPERTYRFKHVITQQVAYQTLPFAQRRTVHRTVAETLEHLHRDRAESMVGLLAYHWDQAGYAERAIGYLLQAGERAQRAYANGAAMACLSRVLELVSEVVQLVGGGRAYAQWQLEALRGMGQVCYGLGDLPAANRLFRQAIELGKDVGLGRDDLIHLYHWLGEVLWWQGERDEHVVIADEALALLVPGEETLEAVLVNQTVATARLGKGDRDGFADYSQRSAQFLQKLEYSELLRPAYTHIVSVYLEQRNTDTALRWLEILEEKALAIQDLRALAEVHLYAGTAFSQEGALDRALARWYQAVELFEQLEDTKHESWCLPHISDVLIDLGDLELARTYAYRGLVSSETVQVADHILLSHRNIGRIALCKGQYALALEAFESWETLAQQERDRSQLLHALIEKGYVDLARGESLSAQDTFSRALKVGLVGSGVLDPRAFAAALAGLERAMPAAPYRGLVRDLRERLGEGGVSQWFLLDGLVPALASMDGGATRSFVEPFVGASVNDWMWVDPLKDCSYRVDRGLTVRVANGRDLARANTSAPRLLRQARGDLALETVCASVRDDLPAIGGLVLWWGRDRYLRLDWGRRGPQEIEFGGCLDGQDVILGRGLLPSPVCAGEHVYLRLERIAQSVRAWCSLDGETWLSVGQTQMDTEDEAQVGLFAVGAIDRRATPGAYPEGSAIRFESFAYV